jgi:hypothetical protein
VKLRIELGLQDGVNVAVNRLHPVDSLRVAPEPVMELATHDQQAVAHRLAANTFILRKVSLVRSL